MNECDQRVAEKKMGTFTDILFSWSLEDISDENLYKDKVKKIPEAFESVQSYLGSYLYPLLEETRAQMSSSMEIMYRAPFAEVVVFEETKPYGTKAYQVRVDYWRNRFSDRSNEPYKTLPGDLLILTNAKPETLSDLDRAGRSWALLSVASIADEYDVEDDTEDGASASVSSTYFKVKSSKDLELEFESQSSLFVVHLVNLIPHKRIWKALRMTGYPKILKDVLCINSLVYRNCDSCPEENELENLVSNLAPKLNESQKRAIFACLHNLNCREKSAYELIWGPPGTGKTKTTATILVALMKMKVRTLICAPTNVAVTEVASRVVQMVADAEAEASFCSLGDILLFGNKERLKLKRGSEMQDIYLDHRVQRLGECVGPFGLNSSITSMISFLEDCVPQYHVFLENELIRKKEEICREQSEDEKTVKSFHAYVSERFVAIAGQLRKCISIFCTHIPKSYITEENFLNMMSLSELLDCLESILFQDFVDSEELEELFSRSESIEESSDSSVDRKSLPSVKRSCLSFLRCLHGFLKELDLPTFRNEEKTKAFCFQRASLVFCTVSTSYKLCQMEIEPMNVLVIDEAAQLKECESTIPLQLPGIKLAILVGDERQLPATVTSKICEEANFGRSLFERLSSQNHPKHLLDVQYRMHPSISYFPNSKFYENQIQDAPIVKRKSYEKHYLLGSMFGSYSFLNVIGGREEKDDDGHSRKNSVEVAIVLKILQSLYKAWLESPSEVSIGIVSPYAAQVVAIQDKLGKKYDNIGGFQVKAKTVDGFQGGEEDIIIMSTVRSGHGHSLEFISNPQRINVALTRARHCLWMLGNERTLTGSQSIWGSLVIDAKDRGRFFDADDDKDLAKTILEVKKELDQFDDLLNADSVLFKNSKWKVLFSDSFLKSFKKLTSVRVKKSVLNLLLKLSGGWRPKRPVLASGGGSSVEIMQFKVEGSYVISTVDILKYSEYLQVLRIWDILAPDNVAKLIKRLDGIFMKHTNEFINLCNEKSIEGNLEIPKSWPPSMDIVRLKDRTVNETESDVAGVSSDGRSYIENSRVSESLLLMKFYSLCYGVVNYLLSDRDGEQLDLPFEVTDEEMEIILFPRSTFILGRSGTGKTTVLTMKLFRKEQLHHKAMTELCGANDNEVGHDSKDSLDQDSSSKNKPTVLRQLFVTVSPKLCNAIKKHVSDLKSFACGDGSSSGNNSAVMDAIDDEDQFNNIPDSFIDINPDYYPLVITFHKFLMMLDGTLSNSYFERFVDMSSVSHNRTRGSRSVALQTFLRTKEVTYDKFSASYWPHFNSNLTKKIDSSRVFAEMISHIKGGPKAMDSSDFKLSRESYVRLSEGRSSGLSSEKREMIYDIFQTYEKMKMERGEFDLADLVINLHSRLTHERYEGDQMDFVYIDEVQDLTMSQIAVFEHVCSNVEEGFVFAGDTAQTIARGIDFRFQEIRSLFYNRFLLQGSKSEHEDRSAKGRLSGILSLSQNFRTHAGILKLSQSIVELLYHFFPHSIDVLKPETSLIFGEAPVLLQSGNNEDAIVKIFGNNAKNSGNFVGFGAEQVILVRDDNARREITELVGKQALLLTILECKGLEFQDVLLYNFFGSSPLKHQWRVIYDYMKEMNLFDSTSSPNCPKFSETKHNILSSELKQLYVAVTRTRQRLWICENSEFSDPIFDYLKKKCLVQVRQLNDSLAQAMQVASSPEEWRNRGIKLYHEKNYEWATVCFERADDKYWEGLSKASGLKATAESMRSSKPEEANSILREAAEIFESIGKADFAAKCFADLGEYERAGKIYLEKCGKSELSKAAECFTLAGLYKLAAEVYACGNFFSECLIACAKGKFFNMGLEYIKEWKQQSKNECGTSKRGEEIEKVEQEFLERCALYYHEIKDKQSMMNFVRAFNSMNSIREFLRPLCCFDEILLLEMESGNFVEAANVARTKGDIHLLIDLLGKARKFSEASSLILFYVLAKSLWSPGKGWPLKQFEQKDELLSKAKLFAKSESDNFYEFVCVEANSMSNKDGDLRMIVNQMVTSQKHKSVRGEILSARKLLDAHLSLKSTKFSWEEKLVLDLKKYSEDAMLKNRVSVESLVYFWDSWKGHIVNVFEYFKRLETLQDANEYRNHGEFCLNFFGVWRQFHNSNPVYLLLSSDADWARAIKKKSPWKNGVLVSVDGRSLASSARTYWCSEVLSVGIKVLETLKAIYSFQAQRQVSPFCISRTLTFIYQVADHLLESKYLKRNYHTSQTLNEFIRLAGNDYVGYVFPSDWRKSFTAITIHLRGTDISKNLLTRFVAKYANSSDLSYGQIGCVVMIILGSGMIDDELFKKIMEGLEWNPPWEAFLSNLYDIRGSEAPLLREPDLFRRLHQALADTLNVNLYRATDYISPHCFFYLIETLLNTAASIQGHIVTTQSSFVEWLVYREEHSKTHSTPIITPDLAPLREKIRRFVVSVIMRWLNNRRDIIEWIRKSYKSGNDGHSPLVTRMIVVICLLQANFGKCTGLLFSFLGRQDIAEQLPREFLVTLVRGRDRRFLDVLSEAFKKIGNPLVIVSLGGRQTPRVSCPHTVFVDMNANRCKDDILRTLFPQTHVSSSKGSVTSDVAEAGGSCSEVLSTTASIEVKSPEIPRLDSELACDRDSSASKGNESDGAKNSGCFWGVFEELCSMQDGSKNGQFYARKVEENVEKYLPFLTVDDTHKIPFETPEELNQFREMASELKQLRSALETSEPGFPGKAYPVKELCERIKSRRPTMEPILNRLLGRQGIDVDDNHVEAKTVVVAESGDPCDQKDCDFPGGTKEVSEIDQSEVSQASLPSGSKNVTETKEKEKGKSKKSKPKKNNKRKGKK